MLVEPETVKLLHCWYDADKIYRHRDIELPFEKVKNARVIKRYTFAYRLEIDGKKVQLS